MSLFLILFYLFKSSFLLLFSFFIIPIFFFLFKKKVLLFCKTLFLNKKNLGNFLFSHSLSSAFSGLTSVFGMGTGVPH